MVLLPVIGERVVMALCAAYVHAEEHDAGVIRQVVQATGPRADKLHGCLLKLV